MDESEHSSSVTEMEASSADSASANNDSSTENVQTLPRIKTITYETVYFDIQEPTSTRTPTYDIRGLLTEHRLMEATQMENLERVSDDISMESGRDVDALGEGYERDSFCDPEKGIEAAIPEGWTTPHGGFYMDEVPVLEIRRLQPGELEHQSYDDDGSSEGSSDATDMESSVSYPSTSSSSPSKDDGFANASAEEEEAGPAPTPRNSSGSSTGSSSGIGSEDPGVETDDSEIPAEVSVILDQLRSLLDTWHLRKSSAIANELLVKLEKALEGKALIRKVIYDQLADRIGCKSSSLMTRARNHVRLGELDRKYVLSLAELDEELGKSVDAWSQSDKISQLLGNILECSFSKLDLRGKSLSCVPPTVHNNFQSLWVKNGLEDELNLMKTMMETSWDSLLERKSQQRATGRKSKTSPNQNLTGSPTDQWDRHDGEPHDFSPEL